MPEYEFYCTNETCDLINVTVIRKFHMVDEKHGKCLSCGNPLKRKFMDFMDEYKGEGFTRSADAREEKDVWKR